VERLEKEGLKANAETFLQMMLLIGAGAKHIQPEPKGYLSEGYEWLERMDKAGLNFTEPVIDAYIDIYHTQMPNVYELDPYRYNWCVNTDSEEALWDGDPELGIEPHIKERYTQEVACCVAWHIRLSLRQLSHVRNGRCLAQRPL